MVSISGIISHLHTNSKKSEGAYLYTFFRALFIKLFYNKYLFITPNTTVYGIENIFPKKALHIGTVPHELSHPHDATLVNIRGKLIVDSDFYHIGRGCRIDVAENKMLKIGKGGFINPFTNIIVRNGINIGNDTYISWNCLLLDEDYHEVQYEEKQDKQKNIEIGNHVWIGTGVSVYQGTKIAEGCVIAANSVVRGEFLKPNCIIGGNPARIIKENIQWK